MKVSRSAINRVVLACLEGGAKRATVYLSPELTIKATCRCILRNQTEILLTIGKPNYKEREFIKKCKLAKEPFPVKKMQLKWYKSAAK